MEQLMSRQKSSLNPNAAPFIPASYQAVEDFSTEWWDLVQNAGWYRDYWLTQQQQEEEDTDAFFAEEDNNLDDIANLLPTTLDLGFDEQDYNINHSQATTLRNEQDYNINHSQATTLRNEQDYIINLSQTTALRNEQDYIINHSQTTALRNFSLPLPLPQPQQDKYVEPGVGALMKSLSLSPSARGGGRYPKSAMAIDPMNKYYYHDKAAQSVSPKWRIR